MEGPRRGLVGGDGAVAAGVDAGGHLVCPAAIGSRVRGPSEEVHQVPGEDREADVLQGAREFAGEMRLLIRIAIDEASEVQSGDAILFVKLVALALG